MKVRSMVLVVVASAMLSFLSDASAQMLTPGEIVYGRGATATNGSCDGGAVWAVGQDGSNDRYITLGYHPRLSPGGRYLIFKRFDPSSLCSQFAIGFTLWIRDLALRREMQISQQFAGSAGHFFSPQTNRGENQIVISDGSSLCKLNIDGTNRLCAHIPNLDPIRGGSHPTVRAEDNLLLLQNFLDNADGGLYTLNYNTFEERQKVPNTVGRDLTPSWSNDGQKIAFASYPTTRSEPYYFTNLFTIRPDGSERTQLTFFTQPFSEGFSYSLIWTRDNATIINAAKLNGISGIYKIAADGSGLITQVPITAGSEPVWVGGIAPVYSEQQTAAFGGGVVTGGSYSLVDTVGQAFAGQTSIGGAFNFQSGFWTVTSQSSQPSFDYDGDRKTDISVFRPSDGNWYLQRSTAGFFGINFGFATDKIVPADYDGDGKTDVAIYRPEEGIWYIANSADGSYSALRFGLAEDLPAPADYDGDGQADLAVFRPSDGTWYVRNSSNGTFTINQFGANGDLPTIGDFDGDGNADIAVYRPSASVWYQINSSNGTFSGEQFGFSTDKIVPADYDGDGKMDIGIYRPSEGIWYVKNSSNSTYHSFVFGLAADIPAAGDYDGDGKADLAVFRPTDGYWYISNSSTGTFTIFPWGQNGDIPTPGAFGN